MARALTHCLCFLPVISIHLITRHRVLRFVQQAKENFKVKESFETLIRYVLKSNPTAGLASGSGGVFGAGMDNDVSREAEETERSKKKSKENGASGQEGDKKGKKEKKKGGCVIL